MKTVAITGASAGVGRATAHAFARRGANVALLARDPRPVAPVYAPEVAADAIVHTARRPCRERCVGWSSLTAIVANGITPGCFDRDLAHTAVRGQQRSEPAVAVLAAGLAAARKWNR
ncbi:hypothetical protein CUJ89_34635 [Burkholderia pyrrocinia]|uniref:SDR family NAD(P)-dependent oxidoreductase n=1 Tax=Burkholderia pyrrocinia TaxID=60550 RepID=A0A2Z5N8X8_BURPY|nr:SDR family NAD(P)-dependent oxidoreductase [Burkholderia pyrrocinia]AXF25590.1 hypothetical protein CUJ89_34635 [Burkholderia pyrrocinia]